MSAHGTNTRTWFANLTSQQHQINNLLDVGHCIPVLTKSHGPAEDRAFRFRKYSRSLFDLLFGNTRLRKQVVPRNNAQGLFELFKASRLFTDEVMVQHFTGPALLEGK